MHQPLADDLDVNGEGLLIVVRQSMAGDIDWSGDFLKELHLTEGRNTGFKKILDALETNGSPKPEFETDEDHSYFITRLYVHEAFLRENELNKSQKGAKKEPKGNRQYSNYWSKILQ